MKNFQEFFTIDYIVNFIPSVVEATSVWIFALPTFLFLFVEIFAKSGQRSTPKNDRRKWAHEAWNPKKIYTKKEVDKYLVGIGENKIKMLIEYFIGFHLFFLFIMIYLYIYTILFTSFELYIFKPLNMPSLIMGILLPVSFIILGIVYFNLFVERFYSLIMVPYLFFTDKERLRFHLKRRKLQLK